MDQFYKGFWEWRLKESPEFATFCGHYEHDHLLDNTTVEAYRKRQDSARDFLKKCDDYLASKSLDETDTLNVTLLKDSLTTYIDGLDYEGYCVPISYMEGIHVDFEMFQSWMKFQNEDDYAKYVRRLEALPGRIAQTRDLLAYAVSKGFTPYSTSLTGVMDQMKSLQENPSKSVFLLPFKDCKLTEAKTYVIVSFSECGNSGFRNELRDKAIRIVKEAVQPSYLTLQNYLEKSYMKALRPLPAASSLPNGKNYYQACLRWHTSLDLTPQAVHEMGRREVERIGARMREVMKQVGFKGEFSDFLQLNSIQDELLSTVKDICYNKIRPTLSKMFHKIPDSKMAIEPAPESKPHAPVACYIAGTLDGSRPGVYFINLQKLELSPKYQLMALSLHEGEPGHHFQGMYAIEYKHLPAFRQHIEDMNYYATPSRFPLYTAYVEGWGLYCESLGEELGLYSDPYDLFGRLSFEMHRACRLVADTGLHALGWTYDQAVSLFLNNSALAESFVHNEVKRYITWPGQAVGYKIGEMKIRALRSAAESQLGAKFNVKDFHDVVLRCGPVPLNILEDEVNKYIEKNL